MEEGGVAERAAGVGAPEEGDLLLLGFAGAKEVLPAGGIPVVTPQIEADPGVRE